MSPLQGRRQLITRIARVHRVNVNIGSYLPKIKTINTSSTIASILRTRDRFRSSSKSSNNRIRGNGPSHLQLREVGIAALDVASSTAVKPKCPAEELLIARNRLAGSHKIVLRGNDAGISFAALDFRFIRNYDTEPWPVQRAR